MIWVNSGCVVESLSISDVTCEEQTQPITTITVDKGGTVESLKLNNVTVINRTPGPLDLLANRGTIGNLVISNASLKAVGGAPRGMLIRNTGQIRQSSLHDIVTTNVTPIKKRLIGVTSEDSTGRGGDI